MKKRTILFVITAALLCSLPDNILAIDATFTVSVAPPVQITEESKNLIFAPQEQVNISIVPDSAYVIGKTQIATILISDND